MPGRLLAALVEAPGHALPVAAAIEALWPGDRSGELVTVSGGVVRLAWGKDDGVR